MDLNLLQPQVEELLRKKGFRLVSMRFLVEEGTRFLRIIVDKYQHIISLDEIVLISEAIDALLDEYDEDSFTLDITTTGAEKEIAKAEIGAYLGLYIKLTMKDGVKAPNTVKGNLEAVSESELTISYNVKGRNKKETYALEQIKQINRAVKY
ncbi:MAG: Ribosome maturation factor RimP [Tenericutes bacterium ADurb.Bin087]|nr:MAG: Ribosome maturation factor RimP [Tenericutes bacterium ADurb.Bin087]